MFGMTIKGDDMNDNGKQLAVVANAPSTLSALSNGLNEQAKVAQLILKSGLAPKAYKTVESVLVACWQGQELGFSTMTALRLINVIDGTPSISAAGIKAKILQSGGQIRVVEWTDETCTLEGIRPGWAAPERATYTMADAKRAGLVAKYNWTKMPREMLYARAVSILGRNQWADKLAGVYGTEEMLDATGKAFEYSDDGALVIDECIGNNGTLVEKPRQKPTWSYCITGAPEEKLSGILDYIEKNQEALIESIPEYDVYVFSKNLSKLGNYKITSKEVDEAKALRDAVPVDEPGEVQDFSSAAAEQVDLV
jgi:hypothetical protein